MKTRTAATVAVGSLFVALALVAWAVWPDPAPTAAGAMEAPAPTLPAEEAPAPEIASQEVGPPDRQIDLIMEKGDTVAGKIIAAGLTGVDTNQIVEAVASVLDPRRMRVGTQFRFTIDAGGAFKRLDLSREEEPLANIVAEGGVLSAKLDDTPPNVQVVTMAGAIDSSLWNSINGLDEQPDLAVEMSKLFLWQVDFSRELQPGDRFTVAVEKQTRNDRFVGYGRILAATLTNSGKEHTAIFFESGQGPSYWNAEGESQKKAFLKSPVEFTRISSRFTRKRFHPVLKVNRPHWGVDYAAPSGTPVMAAGDGKVTLAGWNGGLGRTVAIAHGNNIVTKYGHLKSFARGIKPGVRVTQGQVIAYVGSTGMSTGPHLDFRFQRNGKYVDPLKIVDDSPPLTLGSDELGEFGVVRDRMLATLREMEPGTKRQLGDQIAGLLPSPR